ncbi:MAG: hypothetical protein AAFQ21_13500 [Pseudomonadota bacterium]
MPRDVDERKKRKALRKLRRAAELAEAGLGPPLSDWEREFLEEVEARIEEFGSAFADASKGQLDEPLSALQSAKLREIDKKARGKGKSGLRARKPISAKADPAIDDEEPLDTAETPRQAEPALPQRASGRPVFRVIEGGSGKKDPNA